MFAAMEKIPSDVVGKGSQLGSRIQEARSRRNGTIVAGG
jgi:hypothetical protein